MRPRHARASALCLCPEIACCRNVDEVEKHGLADEHGRPIEYLPSWKIRKEDRAREIRARHGIKQGLIAIFECVENCRSFRVRGNRQTKRRAVCTDILHFPARVVVTAADRVWSADARNVRGFNRRTAAERQEF